MKRALGIWTFLLLLFFSTGLLKAKVIINEVLSDPVGNDDGAEWVELYNTNSEVSPLLGCTLYLDDDYDPQKVVFDNEDFVDKFEVITWDSSWLNNSGDQVRLECNGENDAVTYGSGGSVLAPEEGKTVGRFPDGTGVFYILTNATLGEQNFPPPSPTPTNTPTNNPTNTPVPTNAPTHTPVPTSTAKPTLTLTRKPTSTPKDLTAQNQKIQEEADMAQFRFVSDEETDGQEVLGATGVSDGDGEPAGRISPFAYVIFGLGVIFIGVSVVLFVRNKKNLTTIN